MLDFDIINISEKLSWARRMFHDGQEIPYEQLTTLGDKLDARQMVMHFGIGPTGNTLENYVAMIGESFIRTWPGGICVVGPGRDIAKLSEIIELEDAQIRNYSPVHISETGRRWASFRFGDDTFGPEFFLYTMEAVKQRAKTNRLISRLHFIPTLDLSVTDHAFSYYQDSGAPDIYIATVGAGTSLRAAISHLDIVGDKKTVEYVSNLVRKDFRTQPRLFGDPNLKLDYS